MVTTNLPEKIIMVKISLIAAIAENNALGKDNKLIFRIYEDLKRFKVLTSGHAIIMGRKTFESIGRPLPNRTNIIVTRDKGFKADGGEVVHSVEEAVETAKKVEDNEIFIIGGGQIYKQSINFADKLYLTVVEGEPEADTYFPDYAEFKKVIFEESHETDGLKYKFLELER